MKLFIACCMSLYLLSGYKVFSYQHIASHHSSYNFQIIQPYEVASNYQVLRVTDEVLKKNNIPYWAWGGTLLGAMRHRGFIPWDFDTDICIYKKDVDRFLACAKDFSVYDAIIFHETTCQKQFRIKRIQHGHELYGHVDVYVMEVAQDRVQYTNNSNHYFLVSEVKKLVRLPFGPIFITCPRKCMPYLLRAYGKDVMNVAEIMYTHNPHTGQKYKKFKITNFQPAIYQVIDLSVPLDDSPLF